MTLQTTQPYTPLHLETTARSAREIARMAIDGLIDVAPPYQRGPVWDLTQRRLLVRSWRQGIPVPAIMVNDRTGVEWAAANGGVSPLNTGQGLYAVIDGRQRVETTVAWFTGQLSVPASWFDTADVTSAHDTDDGPYVTYTDLSGVARRVMDMGGAQLPMTTAKVVTVTAEAELYLLVNGGGTAQSAADLANAAAVVRGG